MPRLSQRGKILKDIRGLQESAVLYSRGARRCDLFRELMAMEMRVSSTRYLERPVQYKRAPTNDSFEAWISDFKLAIYCHLSRATFDFVYHLVREVWPCPRAVREQRSIRFQCFVALARLASSDTGSVIGKLGSVLDLSHGSMLLITERFIEALLQFETRFIRWPSAKRRTLLANYGGSEFGFHGLIGSMDGTHFYLKRAPRFGMYPETYYDAWHQGGYGYNCLLTADHTGSVIAAMIGWPGSQSDKVVTPHTALFKDPWLFLEKGEEFIFVDCGFGRGMWCVPPYIGASGKLQHNKVNFFVHFMHYSTDACTGI
jgi:hypothetical protein